MSYSSYKSSPRGSRGFIRGSGYRGSSRGGGGDGSWRGSGGSRGYSGSSRGSRGSYGGQRQWERFGSSGPYEARSKYSSGGDRYSSHEGSYRYRGDDSISSYTSRDHSHRVSSPDRKRMRPDHSPASSMHRSHDYGDDPYSSRSYSHGGYESKRMSGGYGGGEDRRTSQFREERERIRSSDYEFRKPIGVGSRSVPRGSSSYRSRSFSRGMRSSSGYTRRPMSYRGAGGGGGTGFIRKRLIDNYGVRKRIATGKSAEYLRRLKLYRLQRLKRLRDREENEEGSDEEEVEEEEIEEEVEITDDENEEADAKEEEEEDDKEKKDEDEEIEEKKDDEEKKKKVIKKIVKIVKKIKRVPKERKESGKEKDENSEDKEIHVTVKQDSEGRDVDAPVRKNYLGQPFMKLECPHCSTSAETFKEYLNHLYTNKHQTAMMNASMKLRKAISKLRLEQREEQRDLDEECKDMNMRTFYCIVCKLNYRSLKSEHVRSDKHQQMRNFLNPICRVCRISCKTPMMYENHICSLDHLKRKHYFDKKNAERQEGNEINMDNFMVLDQVGSGEEESESESSGKAEKENEEKSEEKTGEEEKKEVKKEKKPKKVVNLGSEYCKKIEVYFCDLCKNFLPRIEDQEQALAVHCRGQRHLHWYVKKKDQEALRKRAERIHRMREEQKKAELKAEIKDEPMDEDASETAKEENSKKENSVKAGEEMDVDANMDDKTWNEVNKDLGDLLRQVEEPGSDDEEDSRAAGRRYDRFKHSEKDKLGEDDKGKSEEKAVKAEVVNGDKDDDA